MDPTVQIYEVDYDDRVEQGEIKLNQVIPITQ